MRGRFLKYALGSILVLAAMNFLSCMHERKLVAITLRPSGGFTFPTPDTTAQGVFTALGNYIHPPDTRDITDKVIWKTDVPQLLAIDGGVVSPKGGCGIADVSASMQDKGNLVIGYATVTVNDPTDPNCPGGNTARAVVTVTLAGSSEGVVTSVPAGINCPVQTCGAQFTVGDTIVLTPAPNNGHSFTSWTGCTSEEGNTCLILVPTGSTNLTATFN